MHSELKQRIVLRCWRSLITQGKEARLAKAVKKAKRQEEFDQCLHQAAHISNRDGGHALYKVIRSFRQAKPQERVQLRDSHGNFSWLPKPPKKPDKPESLRPIGVIAPEGKILAGLMRQRLKPALKSAMSGFAQFGFVPGRGTEEAICKALTHVDEAR